MWIYYHPITLDHYPGIIVTPVQKPQLLYDRTEESWDLFNPSRWMYLITNHLSCLTGNSKHCGFVESILLCSAITNQSCQYIFTTYAKLCIFLCCPWMQVVLQWQPCQFLLRSGHGGADSEVIFQKVFFFKVWINYAH